MKKIISFQTVLHSGAFRNEDVLYVYALTEDGLLWVGTSVPKPGKFTWRQLPTPGEETP